MKYYIPHENGTKEVDEKKYSSCYETKNLTDQIEPRIIVKDQKKWTIDTDFEGEVYDGEEFLPYCLYFYAEQLDYVPVPEVTGYENCNLDAPTYWEYFATFNELKDRMNEAISEIENGTFDLGKLFKVMLEG